MNETRREYLKRINFVLDFIESNLDTDLSLKCLAEKAHYSPFHFHRVFSTVVGERVNEYINRKRIERIASILLVEQNTSLKDLAFRYGFNSDNSFSRAFKKYYGISPTRFKSEGKKLLSKIGIEPFSFKKYICSIDNLKQWMIMNVHISLQEIPEQKLASISDIGAIDKAGEMFQKLMEWGHRKKVLATSNFKALLLYHDNPEVTQLSKLRFSACISIEKAIKPEGEIRQLELRKGIYVQGHFEIKAEEIAKAWKSMCIWVIENGYKFRDGDFFEMYHNDPKTHPEQKFLLDICIPIERTENLKLGKISQVELSDYANQSTHEGKKWEYHQLIAYMKELRAFFHKEYEPHFTLGNIYQGNPDFSYFSLTTEELKKQKLKFVIVLDHKEMSFSICLSGQNKQIRKRYWQMFKGSDWNKYSLAKSIDDSLSIIDHMLVIDPDFRDQEALTEQIEKESLIFIEEIKGILE